MEESSDITTCSVSFDFRVFLPQLGRFISVDFKYGVNIASTVYGFAGENPIQCIDAQGLEIVFPKAPDGKDRSDEEVLFWELYEASDTQTKMKLDNLITSDVYYKINFVEQTVTHGGGVTYMPKADDENKDQVVQVEIDKDLNEGMKWWALGDELEQCSLIEEGKTGFIESLAPPMIGVLSNDMADEWESQISGVKAFICASQLGKADQAMLETEQQTLLIQYKATGDKLKYDNYFASEWFQSSPDLTSAYYDKFKTKNLSEATPANQGRSDTSWKHALRSNQDFPRVWFKHENEAGKGSMTEISND